MVVDVAMAVAEDVSINLFSINWILNLIKFLDGGGRFGGGRGGYGGGRGYGGGFRGGYGGGRRGN